MFEESCISQGIYRSLIDTENQIFCMDFNPTDQERYPKSLVDYAYNREVYYLKRLSKYNWCPELLDTDNTNRKVYFKWYNNTCEDKIPDDYEDQLYVIVKDLHREQIYKPAFYRKFFYTDNNNIMHGFTWYSSSNYDEQPLDVDFFKPILNADRLELIQSLAINGKLNMKLLIEKAFTGYIEWPDNILSKIYREIYE